MWPLSQPTKKLKNGRSARRNGVRPGLPDLARPRSASGVGGSEDVSELREMYGASDEPDSELERELERRLRRDAHLARAGIFDLLLHLPSRLGAKLIRSGLDAQYDYYTEPAFRRRVPPDFSSDD